MTATEYRLQGCLYSEIQANFVGGLSIHCLFKVLTEENEEFRNKRSCPGKEIIQNEIDKCINTREENLRHAGKKHSEEVFCG